jgi:uncharacterized protein YndB with AHSA1/START domain
MAAKERANEIRLTRVYDAPVKMVWEAWTDPKQVAQWWGPRGFTITTHSKDLRTGGHWHYTMHGPDGVDYPNKTHYLEVEEHARMVYDHGGNDERAPLFRVTVLFEKVGKKTRLEMTMALPTPEAAEETKKFIRKAGGNSTWDRLAEYLDKESTGKESFVIARSFEAPLEKMFQMWSDPKRFAEWHGGGAQYQEMEAPSRLVYVDQDLLTTVTLDEEGPSRTRVSVRCEPTGAVSAVELETFVKGRGEMTQGWTGSFDKLEARLA